VGCALVRAEETHRKAFSLTPDYLEHATRGAAAGSPWFSEYGVQLSRGFRALKVWLSLKAHGAAAYRAMIQQNVEQARYLSSLIDDHPNLERLAPTSLNIVCYRYLDSTLSKEQLDDLNAELLIQLQVQGIAVPSGTVLKGCYAIRVANTNQRSRREDFDLLVRESVRLGEELAKSMQAAS
jgi:glutamate/tyrosine decarboxylase-like PLP-dependent enzyme